MSFRTPARLARVVPAAVLALGTSTAAIVGTATPAAADDDCYVQLDAPSRITIDRPYKKVEVGLIDPCGIADFVSIDEYGPRGYDTGFLFENNDTDVWDVYDFQTTGEFTTRSDLAWDSDAEDIPFEETTTTVKLGTKASISSKRSGSKVTLSVKATGYSPSAEKFTAWNASSAKIQVQTEDGWTTVKTVSLKGGKASWTRTSKGKQTYRFAVGATGSRWGATSGSTRR